MATTPQILNDRAATLLKKLVDSYISDGQPVGSKQLADMAGLDISSATIRNVMSGLEKKGLVVAPHNSSGKIPTEQGLRMFVDTMFEVQPLQKQMLSKLKDKLNPDQDKDTLTNQELFSIYINKIGPRLTIVNNGKQAVERALNEEFDLILMDMQMPVMDGVEAVSILRDKGCQVPIVALTANAMIEDRERCLAAGFDHFLTKPIQQSELHVKMAEILPVKNEDNDDSAPIRSNIIDKEPELHDIVMRFIAGLPETLHEMKQAAYQRNWEVLTALLHQLVSTSGGLGYPDIVQLTRDIEAHIREQNYDPVDKLLSELVDLSDRITIGRPQISNNSYQ